MIYRNGLMVSIGVLIKLVGKLGEIMTIPTIQNLELLETVRTQSINPTIDAVNGLIIKASTIPTIPQIEQAMLDAGFYRQGSSPIGTNGLVSYGFTDNDVVTEQDVITAGTHAVQTTRDLSVTVSRTGTPTPSYIFFWKEGTLPNPVGFSFGGLLDTWTAATLEVSGKSGVVFRSDNKTFTDHINFDVKT